MKIESYFCDRCGVELSECHVSFTMDEGLNEDGEEFNRVEKEHEICIGCAGRLLSRIFGKGVSVQYLGGEDFRESLVFCTSTDILQLSKVRRNSDEN
jgi:hypothetical protein